MAGGDLREVLYKLSEIWSGTRRRVDTRDGVRNGIELVDDGLLLGFIDGDILGASLGTDDGQPPHVALQVWKTPVFLQFSALVIAQVLFLPSNINSA